VSVFFFFKSAFWLHAPGNTTDGCILHASSLFATSTLAVGANLPAYLVIIKRLNVGIT
jgi:hypothetical protein